VLKSSTKIRLGFYLVVKGRSVKKRVVKGEVVPPRLFRRNLNTAMAKFACVLTHPHPCPSPSMTIWKVAHSRFILLRMVRLISLLVALV
jgi:hypothetical protein